MSQYGYGGKANPFDQRDDGGNGGYGSPAGSYGAPPSYNQPPRQPPGQFGQGPRPGGANRYNQQGPAMGRDDYGSGSNVEMASLAQNAGPLGRQADPNYILNECRSIDDDIGQVENSLEQMQRLQNRSLQGDEKKAMLDMDSLASDTMAQYRALTQRVRKIKSMPEASQPKNAPQINRIDRRLKGAIRTYQQLESEYRNKSKEQLARQYRYVQPGASDAEANRAAEQAMTSGEQIFQQAVMQSNRTAEGNRVLNAVRDRHQQMQRIEQQMVELAQLFQDMDTLIVQQEVQVANIEQKGEEIVENLDKGNDEIAVAVTTAKKTRKKKWICLGIVVAIILIIVIIVALYFTVFAPKPASKKRGIEARAAVEFAGERPISMVYAQSKIVVPDAGSADGTPAPLAAFSSGKARRYVVSGTDLAPPPDAESASSLFSNLINVPVAEPGSFRLDSLAANKRHLVLPGGRAFDSAAGALARGREVVVVPSEA